MVVRRALTIESDERAVTVGAIASSAAAVIHAAAAGVHADHGTLARLFLVLAALQATASIVALRRDDALARTALIAVNGSALAGWLVTRRTPIPAIDGLEVIPPAHLADITAAVLASVAIAGGLLDRGTRLRRAEFSAIVGVVALLGASGVADAVAHDHSHDANGSGLGGGPPVDGDDEGGIEPPTGELPPAEVEAILALGATDAGPPPDHDHASYVAVDVADHQRDDLDAELAFAQSVIDDVDTVEEAAAHGYVLATAPSPGIGTHWVKWSQILQPFDLRAPAMLLFDHERSPPVLVGYSYTVQSATTPVGFTGDSDEWHRHTGMCVRLDGWVVRERAAGPDACNGSFIAGGDFWMLHAWLVPGWENRDGVFAPMNPKLCPPPAGTPDHLRCPDDS